MFSVSPSYLIRKIIYEVVENNNLTTKLGRTTTKEKI
jgi:hypothetical protein